MLLSSPRWLVGAIIFLATSVFGQIAPGHAERAAVTGPNDVFRLRSRPQIAFDEERGFLQPGTDPGNRLGTSFLKHLARDPWQFWRDSTAPPRFDSHTVLPAAAFTSLL